MNAISIIKQSKHILTNYYLSHKKLPYLASFKITHRCNLTCHQCPFYKLKTPDIPYHQALKTLDKLYERGNRIVIFEGGEPSLWKDNEYNINTLVYEAKNRFVCVGMTTNGINSLDIPVDVLWVSIDGFEETHNALRRANVYQSIIKNVINSNHPKLYAHITINALNYQEIPDLIKHLSKIFKGITIQFYYPYDQKFDLYLNQKNRIDTINGIIKLKKNGYPVFNSISALEALKFNSWSCKDWLIDNANPDGTIIQGCYLKTRSDIDCSKCGFSPHTEISLAFNMNIRSIIAGYKIFFSN